MATDYTSHGFPFTNFCTSDFVASVMDWRLLIVVIMANFSIYLILFIIAAAITMSLVT